MRDFAKIKLMLFMSVVCLLAGMASPSKAQPDLSAETWFDHRVGLENSGLINGHEYLFPFRGASSNPFFFAEGGSKGQVLYNGQWYADILLMYDIYSNEVILSHQARNGQTKLICFDQSLLEKFSLFDHHFSKIDGQFYDVLFQGRDWAFLALRKKSTYVSSGKVEFEEEVQYFLQDEGKLQEYQGKKMLMSLCPQPNDLQIFIKENRIKLGKKRESDLVLICGFIEKNRNPVSK